MRFIILGNIIMYPSINRQGSYGRPGVSYGPAGGRPGQIPGYDLRVSYHIIINYMIATKIIFTN